MKERERKKEMKNKAMILAHLFYKNIRFFCRAQAPQCGVLFHRMHTTENAKTAVLEKEGNQVSKISARPRLQIPETKETTLPPPQTPKRFA